MPRLIPAWALVIATVWPFIAMFGAVILMAFGANFGDREFLNGLIVMGVGIPVTILGGCERLANSQIKGYQKLAVFGIGVVVYVVGYAVASWLLLAAWMTVGGAGG